MNFISVLLAIAVASLIAGAIVLLIFNNKKGSCCHADCSLCSGKCSKDRG